MIYSAKEYVNVFSITLYANGDPNAPVLEPQPVRQAVNGYAPGNGPDATPSAGNDADGDGDGVADGPPAAFFTEEWWKNLFKWLFVPSDGALEAWAGIGDQLANWGPFGILKGFNDAWAGNSGDNGGAANYEPVWTFSYPPPFTGTWQVDFRNSGDNQSVGYLPGKLLAEMRPKAGAMIYICYFFGLMRFLRPRLTI
jgi:hypothetical protein